MDPAEYHHWYDTDRGRWVGKVEFRLVRRLLAPQQEETVLDVGCGTGYFTHRFAQLGGAVATGLDPDIAWLAFAAARASPNECYVGGRAEHLPFADRSFDHVMSIAALCFLSDPRPAFAELLRVTRHRYAV